MYKRGDETQPIKSVKSKVRRNNRIAAGLVIAAVIAVFVAIPEPWQAVQQMAEKWARPQFQHHGQAVRSITKRIADASIFNS